MCDGLSRWACGIHLCVMEYQARRDPLPNLREVGDAHKNQISVEVLLGRQKSSWLENFTAGNYFTS